KEANYEEILSSLVQDIKLAEKQRARAGERMEWCAHNWLFYTGIGWVAYLLGFILHVWPERHGSQASGFLVHATAVATIPAVIYYGNKAIRSMWQRSIRKHDARIARLREELKERLDELKKKTAFDSTKSLIDRFSAGEKTPTANDGGLAARLKSQEAKNRRRTMPNFGMPGSHAAGVPMPQAAAQDPSSVSPLAAKSQQHLRASQQNQQRRLVSLGAHGAAPTGALGAGSRHPAAGPVDPAHQLTEAGVVKVAPRGSALQGTSGQRPWLDKLVDQLVGDVSSGQDKYALICRHCYAHNGLVLEEEIRDIKYSCPKCGKFNPSQRSLSEGADGSRAELETPPAAGDRDSSRAAACALAEHRPDDLSNDDSDEYDDGREEVDEEERPDYGVETEVSGGEEQADSDGDEVSPPSTPSKPNARQAKGKPPQSGDQRSDASTEPATEPATEKEQPQQAAAASPSKADQARQRKRKGAVKIRRA
ncbi:hypothetical protein LPJ61_002387, partial [Coemansia biformis]